LDAHKRCAFLRANQAKRYRAEQSSAHLAGCKSLSGGSQQWLSVRVSHPPVSSLGSMAEMLSDHCKCGRRYIDVLAGNEPRPGKPVPFADGLTPLNDQ